MASLVLCKVCLFLLLTIVVAVAVPEKKRLLLRPYLKLSTGDSGTGSDITTVLNELGCDYDNKLTLFYSSKGLGFLPEFRAPTPAFVNLYNGNIELLWMIKNKMWLEDMCEEEVLKDLSSLPFCSNLESEEALEQGFISAMSSTLSTLQLTDIIQFASDLQKLKGKEECVHVCGGMFKNVLCNAFTGLSTFIMNQVIKIELKNYRKLCYMSVCSLLSYAHVCTISCEVSSKLIQISCMVMPLTHKLRRSLAYVLAIVNTCLLCKCILPATGFMLLCIVMCNRVY